MLRSILVDNSVLSHGEFAAPVSVDVPGFGNRLLLMQAKAAKDGWLRSQIEALPTIARLSRSGALELFSYSELEFEHWRGASFPGNPLGNLFQGVRLRNVNSPIDRSIFSQTEMADFISKKSQTEFCEWLMEAGPQILERPRILERLSTSQISALGKLGRYKEICRSLSRVQFIDAWHVWTGELSGIDWFLTTDKKFNNALSSNKKLALTCKVIYPEELLVELEIADREPMPFEYGRRYYLNGVPYE